jgi:hypothetical protein
LVEPESLFTEKSQSLSFNFTFCYTENVLSLNNSKVGDFVDQIYPNELEIKDTTGTARFASYLDLHLEIDSESRFVPFVSLLITVVTRVSRRLPHVMQELPTCPEHLSSPPVISRVHVPRSLVFCGGRDTQ